MSLELERHDLGEGNPCNALGLHHRNFLQGLSNCASQNVREVNFLIQGISAGAGSQNMVLCLTTLVSQGSHHTQIFILQRPRDPEWR